jgi:N-carbamoyl-L-amino-acid hydrolase
MRDAVGGVDAAMAHAWFSEVAERTQSGPSDRGVTRSSYGAGEDEAFAAVVGFARSLGLSAGRDAAGNLLVVAPGVDGWPRSPVVVGSHLDSVPRGGNYDGLAGVIAALLVVREAYLRGARVPVVGLGLRGEESAWFGTPYLGSKALLGRLTASDLGRRRREVGEDTPGPELGAEMRLAGADVDRIGRGERLLPPVREFWELHIEQGPVLWSRGARRLSQSVGLVDAIRGNVRAPSARVLGQAGHSGTTPHELRQDAVLRFAQLLVDVDRERSLASGDLTVTCGIVGTDPDRHAMTTIADEVRFALDVRSTDDDVAEGLFAYARERGGGHVDWGEVTRTPSARMHRDLGRRAKEAAENLGTDYLVMPSGAGHDAAVFAGAGIPSGMVFVRNDHGSHNPDEHMEVHDFLTGVRVLAEAILSCLDGPGVF